MSILLVIRPKTNLKLYQVVVMSAFTAKTSTCFGDAEVTGKTTARLPASRFPGFDTFDVSN